MKQKWMLMKQWILANRLLSGIWGLIAMLLLLDIGWGIMSALPKTATEACAPEDRLTYDVISNVVLTQGDAFDPNDYVSGNMASVRAARIDTTVVGTQDVTLTILGKCGQTETATLTLRVREADTQKTQTENSNTTEQTETQQPDTSGNESSQQQAEQPVITYEELTETEEIPYTTIYQTDATQAEGTILKAGVTGEKTIVYRVTYQDGVETSREIIQSTITKEAEDAVVVSHPDTTDEQEDQQEQTEPGTQSSIDVEEPSNGAE